MPIPHAPVRLAKFGVKPACKAYEFSTNVHIHVAMDAYTMQTSSLASWGVVVHALM